MKVVEAQQTIAELRKTQSSVRRSLGETRDAVLWLQKLEILEQQLVLVPEYRERAKKVVADMESIARRVAEAKKRASALSGRASRSGRTSAERAVAARKGTDERGNRDGRRSYYADA